MEMNSIYSFPGNPTAQHCDLWFYSVRIMCIITRICAETEFNEFEMSSRLK